MGRRSGQLPAMENMSDWWETIETIVPKRTMCKKAQPGLPKLP
jgi:hypothetical protein